MPWMIIIIFGNSTRLTGKDAVSWVAMSTLYVLPVVLLSVAPAKAVSRRLIWLGLGLLVLIALNELSKLGDFLTAPQGQG
jgi:hypothetical protein